MFLKRDHVIKAIIAMAVVQLFHQPKFAFLKWSTAFYTCFTILLLCCYYFEVLFSISEKEGTTIHEAKI